MPKSPELQIIPRKSRRLLIGIFGFCLGMFGLLYGLFWEFIFNSFIQKDMILHPDSLLFQYWKSPPVKITLDMYLFNWTNAEDFRNLSIKPHFEELGPYRFEEVPEKADVTWHPENFTMSYRKLSKFYFDAEGSNGTLEDKITTINMLAAGVTTIIKNFNPMRRAFLEIGLKVYRDDITLTKTANELLFEGFEDLLLRVANFIPSLVSEVEVPFDKFGYCYGRNGSSQFTGLYNIFTGADDYRKSGQLHTWNHKTSTKLLPSQCSAIYGSAGELQPQRMKENDTINFFVPDLCRTVNMEYEESTEVEGLQGYKYVGGLRSIDNGTLYPENTCFCNGECVPSGVMNISSCWYGASAFMSYPHFYQADPYYLDQLTGLKPSKDKHEFYVVIEPQFGLTLDLKARYQANLLVEPSPHSSMFRNVRKIFIPLFWFEERFRVTPELAGELKMLPKYVLAGQIFGGICFTVGFILLIWPPLIQHFNRRLLHQIEINCLEKQHKSGINSKNIDMIVSLPEVSPLLNRKLTESGDPTLEKPADAHHETQSVSTSPCRTSLNTG